jgi:hypothetical protein
MTIIVMTPVLTLIALFIIIMVIYLVSIPIIVIVLAPVITEERSESLSLKEIEKSVKITRKKKIQRKREKKIVFSSYKILKKFV